MGRGVPSSAVIYAHAGVHLTASDVCVIKFTYLLTYLLTCNPAAVWLRLLLNLRIAKR